MCLEVVYRGKKKSEALAKLPESGYYWKVVKDGMLDECTYSWGREGNYYPSIYHDDEKPFKIGWNYTTPKYFKEGYKVAFHLFRSRKQAVNWTGKNEKTIRCKVEKKDIINIGEQTKGHISPTITIVTKRFWMPKPKKKIG